MLNQQLQDVIHKNVNPRKSGRELVYSCTVVQDPSAFGDIEKVVIAKQLVPVLIFLPFLYIFDVRYDFVLDVLVFDSNNICLAIFDVNLNSAHSWGTGIRYLYKPLNQ